jgi:LacI family transcriptional regulator
MPQPPTAIFSCNNKMTLGVVQALSEFEVACPQFLSLVSFDDFPWTSHFQPRLTAISQPSHEMGRRAMQVLLSVLDADSAGQEPPPENVIVMEPELTIRQSSAPPRSSAGAGNLSVEAVSVR